MSNKADFYYSLLKEHKHNEVNTPIILHTQGNIALGKIIYLDNKAVKLERLIAQMTVQKTVYLDDIEIFGIEFDVS